MVYSSLVFIFFFAVFLATYWLLPWHRARLLLLLVGSLAFYAFARADLLLLLFGVIALGWVTGLAVARPSIGRAALIAGVVLLLTTLATFKYGHLVLEDIRPYVRLPGRIEIWILILPIGISFFVFEVISYLADIRRRLIAPERSPFRFALFISFFPHLVAGPIMRGGDLLPQFDQPKRFDAARTFSGLQLFVLGFFKKVVIADSCARVVDATFGAPAEYSTIALWLGSLAYAAQIFGDFSGYTDMGRGTARMLGFEMPINFLQPYLASSPRDFWRRWHISLSLWLRDYLYRGLGGNRRGRVRTYLNLMVTMLLGGLWHGSNWTFLVWGGYHGLLLALQRLFERLGVRLRPPRVIGVAATFLLVMLGWVIFRSASLGDASTILIRLAVPSQGRDLSVELVTIALLSVAATFGYMLLAEGRPWFVRWITQPGWLQGAAWGGAAASVFYLIPLSAQPFIYFRF